MKKKWHFIGQTHLKDFKQRVSGLRKEQKISVLGVSREEIRAREKVDTQHLFQKELDL